jgi:hypothetical protein
MSQTVQSPTAKQLSYLRVLANQTGTTFVTPRDRRQASREIDRLTGLKRHNGRHGELPNSGDHDRAYATAAHPSEITGYGISCRWRTTAPSDPEQPGGSNGAAAPSSDDGAGADACAEGALAIPGTPLGSYRDGAGAMRDLVSVKVSGGALVVDLVADGHNDARLVGRLSDDEPPENAEILTRLYLSDPYRGRCRRLTSEDLQAEHPDSSAVQLPGAPWDAPLVAGTGVILRVQIVTAHATRKEIRWTRADAGEGGSPEPISLRSIVAELQHYQPAVAITTAAIRAHQQRPGHSSCALRGELRRVIESPVVLNRRLRERVEQAVADQGLSMSEIALRCGRDKRDKRGNVSGETSWLARRIGQLPEAGAQHSTPWVHTDVLARIARDGLGVSPLEVEVPWQE